jgi:branched-chain amino acid transport system substrate-binding protein
MHKLLRPAALAVAVGSLLLSACGSSGSDDEDTIRIASIAPMSGPASVYGKSITASMQYAIDEKNKDGGVEVGGKKYKLELELLDDKQTPETAQSVLRKALDDGYDFIFGPFGSGTASSAQSIMAQSDAYYQLTVAVVEGPTKNPNVFRTGSKAGAYTDITLEYLKLHPEMKKIGMITDQLHTGLVGEQKRLVKGIEDLGREVVLQQKMQLGDTDFRAPLTKMLSVDPDIYLLRGYPAETALLTKQAAELGGEVPLMWGAGMTNDEAKTLVGDEDALARVSQAAPLGNLDPWLAAKDPLAMELNEGLGDKVGAFAVSSYDGAQIFMAGLEKASEPTPEALQKALAGLTAEDVADITIQDFQDFDNGKLFKDREVSLKSNPVEWKTGTGFVIAE